MARAILLLAAALLLSSCSTPGCSGISNNTPNTVASEGTITEFTWDGCHYIRYAAPYKGGIVHKGNCPNHARTNG